jgi:ABC-type transport system involved in cytochrome c biogenesis permease subunit
MSEQQHRFEDNPLSAERPTDVEKRGVEVWRRLLTYQAYSGDRFQTAGMVLLMPRPSNAALMTYTAKAVKEAQAKNGVDGLVLLQLDCLKSLRTYWDAIPRDDRYMPTENKTFDDKYASWVQGSSVWVPLKVLLKSKPEDLVAAGYPEAELKSFLAAYDAVNENESNSPGSVSEAATSALLTASRKLGEAVNPAHYPTVAMMERETHFNEMNPFWQAPIPYATAAVLLALCLGFVRAGTVTGTMGKLLYRAGLAALIGGIGLEVYGFYLRIRITGWSPVTNMYETVVWVALVSAVLSFLFELKFRQVYMALAGSCVALLGTITAANVPLLDPTIRSLQPVLRSNYWLTVHVLTIVSSYAAFALAWGLGLIATVYYLKATYRRSPRIGELALLLIPGALLAVAGGLGVEAAYGAFGYQWLMTDRLFYAFTAMALIGETLCVAGLAAIGGEMINRVQFTADSSAALEPTERNEWANDAPEMAALTRPSVAEIRERATHEPLKLDARSQSMQNTASKVKPLGNFIYRTMQVGVLLIAAGTILGGVWADDSWGRFWGWDPKEVWALITLLVYLIPLHGRFAGWVSSFGLVVASVVCFLSVVMAWYGVNFVLGVGLHSYGFTEGGSQGAMMIIIAAVLGIPAGAFWRRQLGYRVTA